MTNIDLHSRTALGSGTGKDKGITPRAFVVDDELGICKFVALTLVKLGLETRTFHTAQDALAALADAPPAIIFLDIALKNSDAIDMVRGLSEKRFSGIIQMMSGGNPTLLEAVQRVAARHGLTLRPPLQKPFRRDTIAQVIGELRDSGKLPAGSG